MRDKVVKRRLQTKYVPNIMSLGPYIKELKRFEDSGSYQNSCFQEGPKFSSSVKCRFSHDWQFWLCKFLLSTAHYSEILIAMHFGVGLYQSKREKIIEYLYIQPMRSFQTVRPLCSNIDNGATLLPKHYILVDKRSGISTYQEWWIWPYNLKRKWFHRLHLLLYSHQFSFDLM